MHLLCIWCKYCIRLVNIRACTAYVWWKPTLGMRYICPETVFDQFTYYKRKREREKEKKTHTTERDRERQRDGLIELLRRYSRRSSLPTELHTQYSSILSREFEREKKIDCRALCCGRKYRILYAQVTLGF